MKPLYEKDGCCVSTRLDSQGVIISVYGVMRMQGVGCVTAVGILPSKSYKTCQAPDELSPKQA